MLYLYAIAESPLLPSGAGLHGSPLRTLAVAGLFAVVSEHDRAPDSGVEELWRHEEVVEGLMAEATVLPLRFGTFFGDDAELEELLSPRVAEFRALLDDVRGAVELSVRVALPAPPPSDLAVVSGRAVRPSGTAYMRGRGAALRGRVEAEASIHRRLEQLSRGSRLTALASPVDGFKAAYLVDADRIEVFTGLAGSLAGESEALISCTGPWPPYSFVSGVGR